MHAISSAWYGRLPGWSANFAEMVTLVQSTCAEHGQARPCYGLASL